MIFKAEIQFADRELPNHPLNSIEGSNLKNSCIIIFNNGDKFGFLIIVHQKRSLLN